MHTEPDDWGQATDGVVGPHVPQHNPSYSLQNLVEEQQKEGS